MTTQPSQPRAALLSFGASTPQYKVNQNDVANWLIEAYGNQPGLSRWLKYLYREPNARS